MSPPPKHRFFLFRMLPDDSKLTRDEPAVLTRVFLMAALLLLALDLLVFLFFIRTGQRIEAMRQDEFTQEVSGAIRTARSNNAAFSSHIRDFITKKNEQVRVFVSELESSGVRMENQKGPAVGVDKDDLTRLSTLLGRIHAAPNPSPVDVHQAASLFAKVEAQVTTLIAQQTSLENFVVNFRGVEARVTAFVEEVKKTLELYLADIVDLAKRQNENQMVLYKKIRGFLGEFDEIYAFVKRGPAFTTLNNFYRSPFLEFENDFIPFSQVVYGHYNAAKLTETVGLDLTLPRVYYCTLQAYITGLGNFGVKFEFVDHRPDGTEVILGATDEILGSYSDPISVSEMQTFELPAGPHHLYLRVLSQRGTSQLRLRDHSHECISYRNFHAKGHSSR